MRGACLSSVSAHEQPSHGPFRWHVLSFKQQGIEDFRVTDSMCRWATSHGPSARAFKRLRDGCCLSGPRIPHDLSCTMAQPAKPSSTRKLLVAKTTFPGQASSRAHFCTHGLRSKLIHPSSIDAVPLRVEAAVLFFHSPPPPNSPDTSSITHETSS